MAQFADPRILHRVAEAPSRRFADWKEGVSLEARSGKELDDLHQRATADRIQMALDFRRRATALLAQQPPMHRDAISRNYYAIYHAFRAAVFFITRGDEHNGHSELQKQIPDDFPDSDIWKNNLKIAREIRNSADYDLYPKSDNAWRDNAELVRQLAARAIPEVRSYLRSKGCSYL
jgi:uncharacterized protein (UPF0332 family)